MKGLWTRDHWILFKCTSKLKCEVKSSTYSQIQSSKATLILSFFQCSNYIFLLRLSVATFVLVEWTDTYIIHHKSILRRSYGKSVSVRFEPIIIEFCLESHDHWIPFRCCNQLSYQVMSSTRTLRQLSTATPRKK